jgi:predicted esterase
MSIALNIPAETHGRYLVDTPSAAPPAGLLVGFHGYGEGAEAELARLQSIPGAGNWLLVSIQGLHRFYNRQAQQVVASWMTSQDRELAIADNLRYVAAVLEVVARDLPTDAPCVFAGFSQGVAMAFRAACNSAHPVAGIISAGGDVPPELERDALTRVHAALIARGRNDE